MSNGCKLTICDAYNYTRIAWYFAEDGDYGAVLGDQVYTNEDLSSAKSEDREHVLAVLTAGLTPGVQRDSHGYFWNSLRVAREALRAIKAVLKSDPGGAWPEWAVKAQTEGWTAPKGWKP